jgi:isopentenyl diphosphate isomerase/L-lactate dehydrogenase-like FMN-dependent dehydrogenase
LREEHKFTVIASGGIHSSFDIAKALCLGADMSAAARPVIKAVVKEGREGLKTLLTQWKHQMKIILTLLGCEHPDNLSPKHIQQSS